MVDDHEGEIWKVKYTDEECTFGLSVSNLGNLSRSDGSFRNKNNHTGGYDTIGVHVGGRLKIFYVHRLVAELFCHKPSEKHTQVNHIDGDKKNNHYSNLEWVTPSRNIKHAHKSGLMEKRSKMDSTNRLPDDVILKAYLEVMLEIGTITETAKKYGMPRTTLSSIVNGRCKNSVTGHAKIN